MTVANYERRRGDLFMAGTGTLLTSSVALLWMLSRPTSRLSQWLNREIDEAAQRLWLG